MKVVYFLFVLSSIIIGCQSNNQAKNESYQNPLNHKFTLLKIESFDSSSGMWVQSSWMKNGTGTLDYTSKDTVWVEFLPENFEIDSNGRYAYSAKYEFNKNTGLVSHTRLTHTSIEEIGKTVTRKLSFTNDSLIMQAEEFGLRLFWKRLQ